MSARPDLVGNRYQLREPLGVGGMGRVWRARDESLGRDVAIKLIQLPAELVEQHRDVATERALREARAAARLNHPNVVRVYDVLKSDDQPWLVMEYVPSRSLQEVVTQDGPVEPRRAAQIGLDVLSALRAANLAGVQHRDIKPSNVLLTEDGRVVLTDFGIATIEGDTYTTRTGLVLGSPEYIAPERARSGISGAPADLWSLGATLYFAVEGRSPFQRNSAIETLSALATEDPDPIKRGGPLIPVLRALLRKNPDERANSATVERLLRAATATMVPMEPPASVPKQRRWRRARRAPEASPAPAIGPVGRVLPSSAVPPVSPSEVRRVSGVASVPPAQARRVYGVAPVVPVEAGPVSPVEAGPVVPVEAGPPVPVDVASVSPAEAVVADRVEEAPAEPVAEAGHVPVAETVVDAPGVADEVEATEAEPVAVAGDAPVAEAGHVPVAETVVDAPAVADEAGEASAEPVAVEGDAAVAEAGHVPVAETVVDAPALADEAEKAPAVPSAVASHAPVAETVVDAPALADEAEKAPAEPTAMESHAPVAETMVDAPALADEVDKPLAEPTAVKSHAPVAAAVVDAPRVPDGVDGQTPPAPPSTSAASRRRILIGAVAAVIAIALIVTIVLVANRPRSTNHVASTPPTPTTTPAATTGAPSAAATSAAASSAPTAAPSAPAAQGGSTLPALPAGWVDYHDPTGFSVYVPASWRRSKEGSIMYFRGDGRVLGVDQTNKPHMDPVADWRSQSSYRVSHGDFPNYQEIKIAHVDYFVTAADWEFTFDRNGRQHVNNRGVVISNSKAYGFYWQTADSQWNAARPDLQLVFDSFRPAS